MALGNAKTAAAAGKAATDFEAVFINEFLGSMFEGIKTDGPFGGGPGESIFRSLMLDQYSKAIAGQGGIGLAASVKKRNPYVPRRRANERSRDAAAKSRSRGRDRARRRGCNNCFCCVSG